MPQLSPGTIASELFVIDPDRDERASQLCAETLLTLVANDYAPPCDVASLRSPKRQQFALRSLALGQNFLEGKGGPSSGGATPTTRMARIWRRDAISRAPRTWRWPGRRWRG